MASLPNSGRNAFHGLIALVRGHPAIAFFIFLGASIWFVSWNDDRRRAAYENSPEGKAAAVRQKAEDARKEQASDADGEVSLAKVLVKARLRDPESAQFLAAHVVSRDGMKGVCGYVNARNGFGGMSGNDAFAVIGLDVVLASEGYRNDLKRLDKLCYDR